MIILQAVTETTAGTAATAEASKMNLWEMFN